MDYSKTKIAEVIETAAEHVRAGWTQGDFFSTSGLQVCGLGGVGLACNLNRDELKGPQFAYLLRTKGDYRALLYNEAKDILQERGFTSLWNDEPGRTQDEVVEKFLQVAKELRNEAAPE